MAEMPEKSAGAFRTIKEAADELDVPQHVLRFWETRFVQIRPLKRAGGRRFYRPDDVDLLKGIKCLLHGRGYTIKGAQGVLRERGPRFVQAVGRGEIDAVAPGPPDTGADEGDDVPDAYEIPAPDRAILEAVLAELRACCAAIAGLHAPESDADAAPPPTDA